MTLFLGRLLIRTARWVAVWPSFRGWLASLLWEWGARLCDRAEGEVRG